MRDLSEITPLQVRVLEVLWQGEGSTASEVLNAVSLEERLARTTIATKLARMTRYGWISRKRDGRGYRYTASVNRAQVQAAQVRKIVGSLFSDDLPAFVSHALKSGDWTEEDIRSVRDLLAGYRSDEDGER